ncbi:hypothetical protein OROGR_032930 [Orobanche gracilis]
MRAQANKHSREVTYEIGDMVYLKIQPYNLKSLAKRLNQKFSPRYYGPYEIEQKLGQVAYKLKLPNDSKVHPVFHVSLLKKSVAPTTNSKPLPACLNEEWLLEVKPEEARDMKRNEQEEVEVLIKWQGLPEFGNSRELAEKVRAELPSFLLEDKGIFEEGGNDRNVNDLVGTS